MQNFKMLLFCSCLFSFILRISTSLDSLAPSQSIREGETLISPEGAFELGFFCPGNSKGRYFGIWYYNISPLTVVWMANRETPLNNTSGVLEVIDQGLLVLVNGTNSTVWSSNMSSKAENPIAQLLDSGNIVVRDGNKDGSTNEEQFVWQCFDYPCDTELPGMKLGWNLVAGLDSFLSSWKSALKSEFVFNEKEIFYDFQHLDNSAFIRFIMTPSGNNQLLHWTSETSSWEIAWSQPSVRCDNYALCGANSICNSMNTPDCACLKGFVPKYPGEWNMSQWSNGSVRITPLSCSKDGFMKYTGVVLPDTSSFWYSKTMVLQECENLCLQNCSCTAYANLNYIRIPVSELGSLFGFLNFFLHSDF